MLNMVESNYEIYQRHLISRRATSERITTVLTVMVVSIIAGTVILKWIYYRKIIGYLHEKKLVWVDIALIEIKWSNTINSLIICLLDVSSLYRSFRLFCSWRKRAFSRMSLFRGLIFLSCGRLGSTGPCIKNSHCKSFCLELGWLCFSGLTFR